MDYDPESYVDQSLPLLVVGTKLDQLPSDKAPPTTSLPGAVSISVNCTDCRQFSIGAAETIQFNKFFDKVCVYTPPSLLTSPSSRQVIEKRYHASLHTVSGEGWSLRSP